MADLHSAEHMRLLDVAMEYLSQNPLKHMGMIFPIQRGTAHILYAAGDGVCYRETNGGTYMLSASTYDLGVRMLDMLPPNETYSFYQIELLEDVKAKVASPTLLPNYHAVYLSKEPLPIAFDITVKTLAVSDLGLVLEKYILGLGEAYLRKRLADEELFGAYVDGALVGFVGVHGDGSMGMLQVLEPHRKKGYGTALYGFIVNNRLAKGYVPFGCINVANTQSLAMAVRLGFTISDERVYWMF